MDCRILECCGSGMFIPDPGSDFFPSRIPDPNCLHPGSRILIKEFKYFNTKKGKKMVLSSKKYNPGCSSRIRMLTFSHPGSRGQKGTQSRIRNTGRIRINRLSNWSVKRPEHLRSASDWQTTKCFRQNYKSGSTNFRLIPFIYTVGFSFKPAQHDVKYKI
jgi:hypothetical protein